MSNIRLPRCLRRPVMGCVSFLLLAAPALAAAQSTQDASGEARVLFKDGLSLLKAGNYAQACPKLARSQELDPGMGTQYRLGECYEGLGRLATAWRLYIDVASAAKKTGRADREQQARERADKMFSRLPVLAILIDAGVARTAGLEVALDGKRIGTSDWNKSVPVDPGEHVVDVTAPGKKRFKQTVTAVERATIQVTVPALEDDSPSPAASPDTARASSTVTASAADTTAPAPGGAASEGPANSQSPGGGSLGGQRIAAIVTGVAGLAGVGVGAAFGVTAIDQWKTAKGACTSYPYGCGEEGVTLGRAAQSSAMISTVSLSAGGVAVAGAVILWVLAPKTAPRTNIGVAPGAGREGGGAVIYGSF